MIETFSVLAYDINANQLITRLPAKGLSFDTRLNQAGSISFSCFVESKKAYNLVAPVLAYSGNPVACYVDRNGVIVWGGILWTQNPTKSTGEIQFGGAEWLSWTEQRFQLADYSAETYPNGVDAATLILQALTDAQNTSLGGPGASAGLQIVAPPSGIIIKPGYPQQQYTTLYRIISDMVQVIQPGIGGVEVGTSSHWDPVTGLPVNTLTVYSPRIGRSAGESGVTFDLSKALDYTWPIDASQSGNTIAVLGGTSTNTPIQVLSTPGVTVGGPGQPPRLDLVKSYSSVNTQDQISLMANGVIQQYGKPMATPTVKVTTEDYMGTFIVGDDARIYSQADFLNRNGVDQYWRIAQQAVTVPSDGEGVATMELTFNAPPSF